MDEKDLRTLAGELLRKLDNQRRDLKVYRDYYRGDFPLPYVPNAALAEYLNLLLRSRSNWCRKVVDITARRLVVIGVRSNESDAGALWDVWQRSGMDARQQLVHRSATRYGITYVTVGRGSTSADGTVSGDEVSIRAHSPLNVAHLEDPADPDLVTSAIRSWSAEGGQRFAYLWTTDEWVLFRLDAASRKSVIDRGEHGLGVVPVVPFKNLAEEDGSYTSDLQIALPIQDRINQTIADRLMTQTYGAHRQRVMIGLELEEDEDGQPLVPFRPSVDRTWFVEDENVKVEEFAETALAPFIAAAEADIKHLASLTDTPPQDLLGEMVNISAEALKAAQSANTAKVQDRALAFGEKHEQVLNLVALTSGLELDPQLEIVWKDTEPYSESQRMDALSKKRDLGVPLQTIWAEMGYSPAQITQLLEQADVEARSQAAAQAAAFGVDTSA